MTKERKLAIDMWLWIRERYDEWDDYFWGAGDTYDCVAEMKHRFIVAENDGEHPNWKGLCWLCNYIRPPRSDSPAEFPLWVPPCSWCPLKSCYEPDTAYQVLSSHVYKEDVDVSEEVYRYYCTIILDALGYKEE